MGVQPSPPAQPSQNPLGDLENLLGSEKPDTVAEYEAAVAKALEGTEQQLAVLQGKVNPSEKDREALKSALEKMEREKKFVNLETRLAKLKLIAGVPSAPAASPTSAAAPGTPAAPSAPASAPQPTGFLGNLLGKMQLPFEKVTEMVTTLSTRIGGGIAPALAGIFGNLQRMIPGMPRQATQRIAEAVGGTQTASLVEKGIWAWIMNTVEKGGPLAQLLPVESIRNHFDVLAGKEAIIAVMKDYQEKQRKNVQWQGAITAPDWQTLRDRVQTQFPGALSQNIGKVIGAYVSPLLAQGQGTPEKPIMLNMQVLLNPEQARTAITQRETTQRQTELVAKASRTQEKIKALGIDATVVFGDKNLAERMSDGKWKLTLKEGDPKKPDVKSDGTLEGEQAKKIVELAKLAPHHYLKSVEFADVEHPVLEKRPDGVHARVSPGIRSEVFSLVYEIAEPFERLGVDRLEASKEPPDNQTLTYKFDGGKGVLVWAARRANTLADLKRHGFPTNVGSAKSGDYFTLENGAWRGPTTPQQAGSQGPSEVRTFADRQIREYLGATEYTKFATWRSGQSAETTAEPDRHMKEFLGAAEYTKFATWRSSQTSRPGDSAASTRPPTI